MKKLTALLLTLMTLLSCLWLCATAEEDPNLYRLYAELLGNREITLSVNAENVVGLEDTLAPYGTVVCTVKQEAGKIIVHVTCDDELLASAEADEAGIRVESTLLGISPLELTWEALNPNVTITHEDGSTIKTSMTGPEQELINFTAKVQGTDLSSYKLCFQGGFITGPGAVYGLWDDLTSKDGSTSRNFCVTFAESELVVEGSGEETAETAEDGALTITRIENCTVSMDEEDIGTLTIHSVLVVK